MHPFPHIYPVTATANPSSSVALAAPGLTTIMSAAPVEFGGPGDQWSPESLLVAAVADCFILSFKAIASASRFEWLNLECHVDGTLDRTDSGIRFTEIAVRADLTIAASADKAKGEKLLAKAEHACLITNSLNADKRLETRLHVAD